MDYCVAHPDELTKIAAVQKRVSPLITDCSGTRRQSLWIVKGDSMTLQGLALCTCAGGPDRMQSEGISMVARWTR